MPRLNKLPAFDARSGALNVIVETPKGSRNKYKYDPETRLFQVHSLLPAGMAFPFCFGFIPSTVGDDGDPLDVLVLMEEPAPAGFLAPARLIGVIEAEQTEDGETERNDRLIAVCVQSHHHQRVHALDDLDKVMVKEVEDFFRNYNAIHGKEFKPLKRRGPDEALGLVRQGEERFQEQQKKERRAKAKAGKGAKAAQASRG